MSLLDPFDVVIRFSRKLARRQCLSRRGRRDLTLTTVRDKILGDQHPAVAERARQALAALWADEPHRGGADALLLERALKLQNYFTQPYFVAERWTKRSAATVRLANSLQIRRDILDGR